MNGLAWSQFNGRALGVGLRLQLSRLIGVVMHLYVIQRVARQAFQASLKQVGQAGDIAFRLLRERLSNYLLLGTLHFVWN